MIEQKSNNTEEPIHSIRLINLEDLVDVIGFINNLSKQYSIPEEIVNIMQLVVDEVYVNFCSYGKAIHSDYQNINFAIKDNSIEIVFNDNGKQFNPVSYSTNSQLFDLPIDKRPPGGLGIHLVKHFADTLDYQYVNGFNVLTFKKSW